MHLVNNPDQRAAIIADPGVIPKAVEEILRIEATVGPIRRATREAELGGIAIGENDQLVLMLCSANRDPAEFPSPSDFNVERFPNRHLSFGAGVNRCSGSHRGRIELTIALEETHRCIPDYRLVESDPPIFHASRVRGCLRLPITFTPQR